MESYLIVKTIHIVSATVIFGTGLGIAFFFFMSHIRGDRSGRRIVANLTVWADFAFTLPAAVIQPISGGWLVWQGGFAWTDYWLALTYILYLVAAACWIPVVFLQIRMKKMLEREQVTGTLDQSAYDRLFRWWFCLGWPAFGGLIVVFFLMVAKPTW